MSSSPDPTQNPDLSSEPALGCEETSEEPTAAGFEPQDQPPGTTEPVTLDPELAADLEDFLAGSETSLESAATARSAFPTSASSRRLNESLLAQVLRGRSLEDQSKILRHAYRAGVEKNDPLFSVLLSTGEIENLLVEQPEQIRQEFDDCTQEFRGQLQQATALFTAERNRLRALLRDSQRTFEQQSQAALDVQNQNISDSVTHLVRKAAFNKVAHDAWALVCAGSVLLGAVAVGVGLGLAVPKFIPKPLDPTGPRQLSLEEAQALEWGMSEAGRWAQQHPDQLQWLRSEQGRYAQQLMQWNQALLSNEICQRDIEELGVTLQLEGRLAKSGFCTLWVEPPHKRQFVR